MVLLGIQQVSILKKMDKFYKEHIYTFVDRDMNKAWLRVSGFEEEE